MKNKANPIVSLFIFSSMAEILEDEKTWNRMSKSQQMLLEKICKSAFVDAFEFSEEIVENKNDENNCRSSDIHSAPENEWFEINDALSDQSLFFKEAWGDLEQFKSQNKLWANCIPAHRN